MTEEEQNRALLPSGFSDLLPPEAGQEADAITALLDVFLKFAYRRVKPPLVEFEEGLFAPGPGAAMIRDTFRLMDPVSHRMMGVRSDITAQIARIASSRLGQEQRPLRLTYANDVLRTKGSQQRTARQFTQVGCEIIGAGGVQADIEICTVALCGLNVLEIGKVTLDMNLPRLSDIIFTEYKVKPEVSTAIQKALADRDLKALKKIKDKSIATFAALLEASGEADLALKKLSKVKLPKKAKEQVARLREVYEGVVEAVSSLGLKDVLFTADVLETRGLEYHNGLAFALYASGARAPMGRGGRYEISFAKKAAPETAIGFTLYMDTVRSVMKKPAAKKIVFVGADEKWSTISDLQNQGWIVARGVEKNLVPTECTHEYKQGKVTKRK